MGRILATELGYVLEADSIPGFLRTRDDVRGKDYSSKRKQILEGHTIDLQKILSDKSKRQIVIDYGFFQRYEYFRPYKAQIKKWMKPSFESIAKVASQDVVLCIRRDDYVPDNALPLSYYEEAYLRSIIKNCIYARIVLMIHLLNILKLNMVLW